MDFDGNLASMQPTLCSAIDYAEVPVVSMTGLMTEHEQVGRNQFIGNAIHGPYSYYNAQPETYFQTALLQAAQAFHVDKLEPHHIDCHYPIEQLHGENVIASSGTVHCGKSEVVAKFPVHMEQRKDAYQREHAVVANPVLAMPQETRNLGSTTEMENIAAANKFSEGDSIRAKILSHPYYPRLVAAYMNCQKVGAPPEIVSGLEELSKEYQNLNAFRSTTSVGADPELDEFMDTYCNMLITYHEQLTRPFKDAMAFLRKIELQLNSLSKGSLKLGKTGKYAPHPEMRANFGYVAKTNIADVIICGYTFVRIQLGFEQKG